jgi:chloramphenicol-sensitive protein RarD
LFAKKLSLNSLAGGQLETLFLVPLALGYFAFHREKLAQHTPLQWLLVISSGIVTGLPLLWFSEAIKRLPYYLMGFFQFIAPTLMFLCGIFIYHEAMSLFKLCGFLFIWSGILYLLTTTLRKNRKAILEQSS